MRLRVIPRSEGFYDLFEQAAANLADTSGLLLKLLTDFHDPEAKPPGKIIEDEDTNETVEQIVAWLEERKLI